MKVEVLDQKGKSVKEINLNDSVFGVEVKESVISQYVYSYLSNQRQSNASTKDRSEVRGGGRKPHKQKGTGRARAGSSRSPLWRSGGIVFGPTNEINWKKKMTKNFKKAAFRNVLSLLGKKNEFIVVESISVDDTRPLTKQALDIKEKLAKGEKKITLVTEGTKTPVMNAFSNLKNSKVVSSKDVNVYDLFHGGKIIFEEKVVSDLSDRLSGKKATAKVVESKTAEQPKETKTQKPKKQNTTNKTKSNKK